MIEISGKKVKPATAIHCLKSASNILREKNLKNIKSAKSFFCPTWMRHWYPPPIFNKSCSGQLKDTSPHNPYNCAWIWYLYGTKGYRPNTCSQDNSQGMEELEAINTFVQMFHHDLIFY